MGRASRRRAEQRASVTARAFPPAPAARSPRTRWLPFEARTGLARLGELATGRAEMDAAIDELVRDLSRAGVGWGDIGRALGLTRQGARQKHGDHRA
jgi:hypothetical protein